MTVATTISRDVFAGNAVTVLFPTTWAFFEASEVIVTLFNDSTGVGVLQAITTNYTQTGGDNSTGEVTMIVAPAVGETLVLERAVAYTQGADYVDNDPFPAEVNERALDRLTYLVQQVKDLADRSLKVTVNSLLGSLTLDDPVEDKVLIGGATAGTIVNGPDVADVSAAGANATAAAASAAAADASASAAAAASQTSDFTWTFDDVDTAASDPGAGKIKFDNAAIGSITNLYINESAIEGDVETFIEIWDDSTGTPKAFLRIIDPLDPLNWVQLSIDATQTDNTGWRTFPVTVVGSNGSMFSDETIVMINFSNNSAGSATALASTTELLIATEAAKAVSPNAFAAAYEKGADVALAGTITLGEGAFFHIIAGTGPVTDIDYTTTPTNGGRTVVLYCEVAFTFTQSVNLETPSGGNLAVAAGDTVIVSSEDGADAVRIVGHIQATPSGETWTEYDLGAFSATTKHTQAHGLGANPDDVQLWLENTTIQANYSVGQRILMTSLGDVGTLSRISQITVDTTNVYVTSGSTVPSILDFNTPFAVRSIMASRWKLILRVRD